MFWEALGSSLEDEHTSFGLLGSPCERPSDLRLLSFYELASGMMGSAGSSSPVTVRKL